MNTATLVRRRAARWRMVALLAAMALLAVGCGGADDDQQVADGGADETSEAPQASDDGSATEADASSGECDTPDSLRIATPSLPPDFIQLTVFVAEELGFYADYCLDVQAAELRSGINALRAMQSGETDVSMSGTVSFINAIGQGSPVQIWASPANRFDFQVLATADSGITSCEQLAGTTVATDGPGGLIHALAEAYLATCDLDLTTDVENFIGSPEDFGPQMEQGIVQASVLHTDDRLLTERERGIEFATLGNAWEYAPDFHYISFGSTVDLIEQNADAYSRVAAALLATNRWMKDPANKEEFIPMAAELAAIPEDIAEQTYDIFIEAFPETCAEALPEESFSYVIELQQELGNLEGDLAYEDVVRLDICEAGEALLDE